jgi:hypothetical protein
MVSPYASAMLYDAKFTWKKEDGYTLIHCPDLKGITLGLRRIWAFVPLFDL